GLDVTLIDEMPALGGQIYRALPEAFKPHDAKRLGKDFHRGNLIKQEVEGVKDRIRFMLNTEELGVWPNKEVLWSSNATKQSGSFVADQLIIATGAYDRPVPFPGWTLPGVMTAGGVQSFIKTMRVLPGQRALVAGTGPLLLVVAFQLAEAGAKVV